MKTVTVDLRDLPEYTGPGYKLREIKNLELPIHMAAYEQKVEAIQEAIESLPIKIKLLLDMEKLENDGASCYKYGMYKFGVKKHYPPRIIGHVQNDFVLPYIFTGLLPPDINTKGLSCRTKKMEDGLVLTYKNITKSEIVVAPLIYSDWIILEAEFKFESKGEITNPKNKPKLVCRARVGYAQKSQKKHSKERIHHSRKNMKLAVDLEKGEFRSKSKGVMTFANQDDIIRKFKKHLENETGD